MSVIFETGGKQYLADPGDKLQVEKISGEPGSEVIIEKVLMNIQNSEFEVGKPYIATCVVKAKILKQGKGKKISVLKYKAKSKYRRKIGHRQNYTEIEIQSVS